MRCEDVTAYITANGKEAEGLKETTLNEHLARCPRCRENAAFARWLARETAASPRVAAPPTLAAAVLARTTKAPSRAEPGASAGATYSVLSSPLGPLFVGHNESGIVRVLFGEGAEDLIVRELRARYGGEVRRTEPPPRVARAVAAFFGGERLRPEDFALAELGPFQREVLRKALEIPWGEVRTYSWIAREIGRPAAVRAVGTALGRNPMPVLIPCHRVLRGDGGLGGYAFGLPRKRQLLALEGVDLEALARDAKNGIRYHGSRTTGIFCYPTCRHVRRVAPENLILFHDETEARRAGYRPCKVCRPA